MKMIQKILLNGWDFCNVRGLFTVTYINLSSYILATSGLLFMWEKELFFKPVFFEFLLHIDWNNLNILILAGAYVASVMSDSLQLHGPQPTRLLWLWNLPGKNTGVSCHALLQGIFLTQGLNLCLLCLLHCRWILYCWATGEAPDGASACMPDQWCRTLCDPMDCQAPLSMGVFRQEYWSGLTFPSTVLVTYNRKEMSSDRHNLEHKDTIWLAHTGRKINKC